MKIKFIKHFIAIAALVIGTSANASLLTVDSGVDVDVASNNDFIGQIASPTYNIGGNVMFTTAGDFEITFTALAQESGFFNFLTAYGLTLDETPLGTSFTVSVTGAQINDLLDFEFTAQNNGTNVGAGIANGGNQLPNSAQSFATILNSTFDGNSFDAILLWDDSGANQDDNHDDMIVGVTITRVSAPSHLALMGLLVLIAVGSRKLTSRA
jgi:hypothetical protein